MRGEYAVSQPDVGEIGADRVAQGIERDRPTGQREPVTPPSGSAID